MNSTFLYNVVVLDRENQSRNRKEEKVLGYNISFRLNEWTGAIYLHDKDMPGLFETSLKIWERLYRSFGDKLVLIVVSRETLSKPYFDKSYPEGVLQYKVVLKLQNHEGQKEHQVFICFDTQSSYTWFSEEENEVRKTAPVWNRVDEPVSLGLSHEWDLQPELVVRCVAWWIKRYSNHRREEAKGLEELSQDLYPHELPI